MHRVPRLVAATLIAVALGPSRPAPLGAALDSTKLDPLVRARQALAGRSRLILTADGPLSLASALPLVSLAGGHLVRPLPLIDAAAIDVPNTAIAVLAASALVTHVSLDRVSAGAMERTGATVGATAVRARLGLDGRGIGIAVIDSGVTAWHDDLAAGGTARVDRFVDFTAGHTAPYDDYGHGTHVAGIVAGNGADSSGARTGIAPAARLTVLKVLDGTGSGHISD